MGTSVSPCTSAAITVGTYVLQGRMGRARAGGAAGAAAAAGAAVGPARYCGMGGIFIRKWFRGLMMGAMMVD
jgi:hypothetical protein